MEIPSDAVKFFPATAEAHRLEPMRQRPDLRPEEMQHETRQTI